MKTRLSPLRFLAETFLGVKRYSYVCPTIGLAMVAVVLLLPFANHAQEPGSKSAQSVRDEPPRPAQSIRDKDRPGQTIQDKRPGREEPKDVKGGDFTQSAHQVRQGVFLVGGPGVGIGTAWVISKEHRLLATNAHVADMFFKAKKGRFIAMMNGSGTTYGVERVWYHPGVKRFPTPDENIAVRSDDPKLGPVSPSSPDVAVLKLSVDGPALPVELKFASPKTLFDLQAMPVAILGFPAHDTQGWPEAGMKAQATFHTGVVSRVTDFQMDGGARDEFAQMLQYTMETWGGYSGSPVFLSTGQVVALHNMARRVPGKGGNPDRTLSHGVRVDCLWELLVHHKLADMVAVPLPADKIYLQRWLEYDTEWDRYRKLAKLVEEAEYLVHTRLDFVNGIAKADEAIGVYARYAPAHMARSDGYNNWYFRQGGNWRLEKKVDYLLKALDSAEIYRKLHPGGESVEGLLACAVALNNLGHVSGDLKYNRQALADVNLVLGIKSSTNHQRASAYSAKGVALSNLGMQEDALKAYNISVDMEPDISMFWDNRGSFFAARENDAQARYNRAMGEALRKKDRLLRDTARKDWKVISEVRANLTAQEAADARGCYMKSWSVELEAGYFYQIDLKSPEFGKSTNYDPILRMHDDKNNFLREDDDGGGYPNSRIFYTPSATASYTLTVTSYEPRQTGPYVLTVTKIARDQ